MIRVNTLNCQPRGIQVSYVWTKLKKLQKFLKKAKFALFRKKNQGYASGDATGNPSEGLDTEKTVEPTSEPGMFAFDLINFILIHVYHHHHYRVNWKL